MVVMSLFISDAFFVCVLHIEMMPDQNAVVDHLFAIMSTQCIAHVAQLSHACICVCFVEISVQA